MSLLSPIAFAALLTLGAAAAQTTPTPSAEDVAHRLQEKYDAVRDFSADFVQQHESLLKRKRVERGTLLVKKPGKMRWQYKGADEKVFVSNGTRMIQYLPLENRAIEGPAPDGDQVAVFFLAGRGHITRDFNVSFATSGSDDVWVLRLEPKQPQQEYDWLEITADKKTLRILGFTVGEKQGSRSTFTLSNFKENPGLADKAFEFSIPRGAEVQHVGPVKR